MSSRVTLSNIAEKANVTKSTVSRALRNDPRLPRETRERIHKLSAELGYVPDPTLATIAASRWKDSNRKSQPSLAYLSDFKLQTENQPGFYDKRWMGAKEYAKKMGWSLEHFYIKDYPTLARLTGVLINRGIHGLAIGHLLDTTAIRNLNTQGLAVVCCGAADLSVPYNIVMPNTFEALKLAWSACRSRGHKKIGIILSKRQFLTDQLKKAIASDLWLDLSPDERVPHLFHSDEEEADAEFTNNTLREWLERHSPQAIIAHHSGYYYKLKDLAGLGRHIPSFVSLSTEVGNEVSGVVTGQYALGSIAIKLLVSAIRNNEFGAPEIRSIVLVDPQWNQGMSLV